MKKRLRSSREGNGKMFIPDILLNKSTSTMFVLRIFVSSVEYIRRTMFYCSFIFLTIRTVCVIRYVHAGHVIGTI